MQILKIVIIILFTNTVVLSAQQLNQIDANGNKIGEWVKYYNNNRIKYKGQFRNDRPYGKFTYYYKEGAVKAVNSFSDDGVVAYNTAFYENGKLMAEGKYINQKKDSIWNYYSNEGSNPLVSKETYENGTLNGESITYYPDTGKPTEIVYFEDGKRNGKLLKYFPDGQLMTVSYYKDDLPDGEFFHYHPNGKVQIEGKYSNGSHVGQWKYFDEKGNPVDKDDFMKQEEVKGIE